MEEGKAPSCSEKTTGDAVTHGANRQHTAGEDRATLVPKANGTQVQKEAPPPSRTKMSLARQGGISQYGALDPPASNTGGQAGGR